MTNANAQLRTQTPAIAWRCVTAGVTLFVLFTTSILGAESKDDFFEARIRPLFVKHCVECHGAKKQEGGLRLDSRDGWMRGGDRGTPIVAGQPEESLLIQAVINTVIPICAMPPERRN